MQIELSLISGGVLVQIPAREHFSNLQLTEVSAGAWRGTLVLTDPSDTLEPLLVAAGADRNIRVRFNWEDQQLAEAPTVDAYVIQYTPEFTPQSTTFTAELTGRSAVEASLNKRVRAFTAGTSIAAIVQELADDRGWKEPLIEPTVATTNEPFSTSGESDLEFVRKQLAPLARNAEGEGGYQVYVDVRDRFHFHTPRYQRSSEPVRSYVFTRDSAGEVISFRPTDNSVIASLLGAGNSIFRSFDSRGGSPIQVTADNNTLEGQTSRLYPDSTAVPNLGTTINYVDLPARDRAELEAQAQARIDDLRRAYFSAEMEVVGTHAVRVFDFIEVTWVTRRDRPHFLSGTFQVTDVTHDVGSNSWTTRFALSRAGVRAGVPGTVPLPGSSS